MISLGVALRAKAKIDWPSVATGLKQRLGAPMSRVFCSSFGGESLEHFKFDWNQSEVSNCPRGGRNGGNCRVAEPVFE
jgi:hypothetical protein